MTTSKQCGLLDTNVLVYATHGKSPFHSVCKALRDHGLEGKISLCVSPQILFEFFAIITSPKRVSQPLNPKQALEEIEKYLKAKNIIKIYPKEDTCQKVIDLSRKHKIKGQMIFDVQIVATMLTNNVGRIYTYDRKDFGKFKEIEILQP